MKFYIHIIILIILFTTIAVADSKDDIKKQQNELKDLNKEIKESEKKLDNFRNNENKLHKRIANSKQKINAGEKVISGLNKELKQILKQVDNAQTKLENRTQSLELSKRRYLGNVRQFYFSAHNKDSEIFTEDPNEEMRLSRQIIYLSSLAGFESENVELAKAMLSESVEIKDDLVSKNKQINKVKNKKTISLSLAQSIIKKQEKDLKKNQNSKLHETDRMNTLKHAAIEMEQIIARLQEEAIRKAQDNRSQNRPSFFAKLKGQLVTPLKGKVIKIFGDKTDNMNLHSNNPSISIKGRASGSVTSVASGTIAYVGELRGYGNFIIINHDDRFFTTYAGLGDIFVQKNNYILAGKKIASAGTDGILRFEIRDKKTPVDPVKWIQIEAFR